MPATKDIKEICRKLDKHKIRYWPTSNGHYRIPTPDGKWITMSGTPGGGNRSIDNTKAVIKRKFGIRV